MDTDTRRHGDTETRGHGDAGTRGHGEAESLSPQPPTPDSHPPKRHRRPPKPLIALLVLALAAGGWWYYTQLTTPLPRGIVASGTIETEEVAIASEVAGRVVQLLADEGDSVKAGDVLVKLDDTLPQLQLKMAPLSDRRPLEVQLDKSTIRSPLDGVVVRRSIRLGEVASPASTMMVVTKMDRVELTLYVPEKEVGLIKIGQPVEVQVDSYPGETFPGKVTFINTKAEFTPRNVQTQKDRLNLVFAVKVQIPNPELRLKPGMPADATIVKDQ